MMGNVLRSCTQGDSVQHSPNRGRARSAHDEEFSELSIDVRRPLQDAVTKDETETPEVDLTKALEQIFLLCEQGVASTIQFILDSHPGVELLINERKACHITDTRMELTPFQLAAACGHGEVIKTLCGNHLTQVNIADPLFSMTALHLAVHLGQVFAVEALCKDSRVEVDEKNVEGKTAMHVAVAHEYTGIVETILRLHPNIDLRIKDFDGNNVFHLAAYHPNAKIMTLLTNHASMVNLYCEYFDITKISSKNKPRTKKQIFEAANYNGETAARILRDSIQRVQKRRADIEAKVARHEAQMREQASAAASGGGGDLGLSMVPSRAPPVLAMASPITTDERSEGTFVGAAMFPNTSTNAAQSATQPALQPYVPPNEPESGLTMSSLQNSPFPEDEEQDLDTLIQCLEVIQSAAQVSPADESLSSFGHHSATGTGAMVERKCSFDLDSNASQAGDNGNDDAEDEEDEEEEEEVLQRTAYSYSPPFTPSLDQDQPDPYFTPKSPKSSIRSKSSAGSLS